MNGANSNSPSAFWSGVEGVYQTSICLPTPTAKCRPDGENARAVTGDLKEKWCKAILLGTFVKIARPSSSTVSSRLPRGVRPILAMFFRCANGRVCDLLLKNVRCSWVQIGRSIQTSPDRKLLLDSLPGRRDTSHQD